LKIKSNNKKSESLEPFKHFKKDEVKEPLEPIVIPRNAFDLFAALNFSRGSSMM
jgi:hypothetical protein